VLDCKENKLQIQKAINDTITKDKTAIMLTTTVNQVTYYLVYATKLYKLASALIEVND